MIHLHSNQAVNFPKSGFRFRMRVLGISRQLLHFCTECQSDLIFTSTSRSTETRLTAVQAASFLHSSMVSSLSQPFRSRLHTQSFEAMSFNHTFPHSILPSHFFIFLCRHLPGPCLLFIVSTSFPNTVYIRIHDYNVQIEGERISLSYDLGSGFPSMPDCC